MPSKTPKQERFMRAIAHGWKPTRVKGPSRAVAKEFMEADMAKRKGYQQGGRPTGQGIPGHAEGPNPYKPGTSSYRHWERLYHIDPPPPPPPPEEEPEDEGGLAQFFASLFGRSGEELEGIGESRGGRVKRKRPRTMSYQGGGLAQVGNPNMWNRKGYTGRGLKHRRKYQAGGTVLGNLNRNVAGLAGARRQALGQSNRGPRATQGRYGRFQPGMAYAGGSPGFYGPGGPGRGGFIGGGGRGVLPGEGDLGGYRKSIYDRPFGRNFPEQVLGRGAPPTPVGGSRMPWSNEQIRRWRGWTPEQRTQWRGAGPAERGAIGDAWRQNYLMRRSPMTPGPGLTGAPASLQDAVTRAQAQQTAQRAGMIGGGGPLAGALTQAANQAGLQRQALMAGGAGPVPGFADRNQAIANRMAQLRAGLGGIGALGGAGFGRGFARGGKVKGYKKMQRGGRIYRNIRDAAAGAGARRFAPQLARTAMPRRTPGRLPLTRGVPGRGLRTPII